MKRFWNYVVLAVVALGMASCVQDLNTTPIDKHSTTGFNQDALFTKIYATLATTGQQGPAGSADVAGADEGVSGFYRVMWELNEFPTDEGWWIWGDPGVGEARTMEWNGDNALVKMLYDRFIIVIMYCNHFIYNAALDVSDAKGQQQLAEVRFIRALNYWYMLDMFKYSPYLDEQKKQEMTLKGQTYYPEFKSRPELYDWLQRELRVLVGDTIDAAGEYPAQVELPDNRLQLYRIDKTAAWLLLARLYLNAEVYTGTPQWAKAKDAADHAISGPYSLYTQEKMCPDGTRFSAYQQLFMGDNDVNGAQKEAVLLIYQDGNYCQSYCGSPFVIASNRDVGMTPWGCSMSWKCFRSSPELVYKFVNQNVAESMKFNEYEMPIQVGDDRAIFCSYVEGNTYKWKLTGGSASDFYACWACPKFTAVYSTADSLGQVSGSHSEWADTDIPFMRIAEAYLTKAEAMFRLGDVNGAKTLIDNSIRARAKAVPLDNLTEAKLCDEWCREFWGEGRRRTDLVRFNRFAGPKADENSYQWEGRAGATSYKSMEEKWNWFPIPSDDKRVNPNFKTQVLATSELEGGDGYAYVQ